MVQTGAPCPSLDLRRARVWKLGSYHTSQHSFHDFVDKHETLHQRERKKMHREELPWRFSGWESICQCRGHGFDSWSGKIAHVVEQLSPCASTTEPRGQEKPLQWEAHAPQLGSNPCSPQPEKPHVRQQRLSAAKNKINKNLKTYKKCMERSTGEWKLIDRNHIDTSPLFKTFHWIGNGWIRWGNRCEPVKHHAECFLSISSPCLKTVL